MSVTKGPPATTGPAPEVNGAAWSDEYLELLPNMDEIVTEDGKPVDNTYVERLYRLLTDPLYASWRPPGPAGRSYVAMSNVGWFHTSKAQPVVPDMMMS